METSLDAKRQAAIEYLRKRKIYRADANCQHRYEPGIIVQPPAHIEVTRGAPRQPTEFDNER